MPKNNGEEIIDQNLTNKAFKYFYKTLFQKTIQNNNDKLNNFLNEISVFCLSNKQQTCAKIEF